ncbi:MAG: hypothetical protein DMG23_04040 [Acidobacteria bacterium]|nr:MAG: hypothetical protein DMG23_04040 [Acidobacteriota bacterium]
MRILAMADIHGEFDVYDRLPSLVARPRAEAVVLAGDLLGAFGESPTTEEAQTANAREISERLSPLRVQVLYVMGNDDFVELEPGSERIQPLHGRRVEMGPYNFVGYEYSPPFMCGVFEEPEEEIAADIARLEPLMDRQTILVTHSPAEGILDRGFFNRSAGSPSILAAVKRRSVLAHIHGHIHACFGREGRHFNVAVARQRRAMVMELPVLDHSVITRGQGS